MRPPARRTVRAAVGALCAAAAMALTSPAVPAGADPGAPGPLLSGWMPYWTTSASLSSYSANADLFSSISPFWYDTKAGVAPGSVEIVNHPIGADRATVLAALRASGKPVIPSITDGTGAGYMAGVLANPTTRSAHIEQLLRLVRDNGYNGIDLDYEVFAFTDNRATWVTTRPNWVAFVTELAARFHANGLVVTAALPISGYWVYDHAAVGAVLDVVRVMTYDYHVGAPGAIAPLNQVLAETRTMLTLVPGHKLMMGIPEYGRDWTARTADGQLWITDAAGKVVPKTSCPADTATGMVVVDARDTYATTSIPGATVRRDPVADELQVTYTRTYSGDGKTCIVHREAWLADPQSVDTRVRGMVEAGAAGVALWTVGDEHAAQWDTLRYYANSRGPIYWSPLTSGAYPVYGAILMRYNNLGRGGSALGLPTSAERNAAVAGARMNTFQGGVIYWSPSTGAQEVYGGILATYRGLGAETSFMGLPTSGEFGGSVPGTRLNTFQRGRIYWSAPSGAHEVYGGILWRYAVLGAEASPLGMPTSGEKPGGVAGSRMNTFQRGAVYWSPSTGAQEVYGGIYARYASLGAERSILRLPTSGELAGAVPGVRLNHFQGGRVYWSAATGAHEIYGAILMTYAVMGAERSPLGLPTSGEMDAPSTGWRMSNFEHGAIYWSAATGTKVVYR